MAPARASFRLLPQPAGSRSRVVALAPWRGFTEVPMPRVLRPVLHGNPASLAGRLARSPGIIGRHAAPHGREKVPPKRCHRGWHPPRMPRRKGQPRECAPSAPARPDCSCTHALPLSGSAPRSAGPACCRTLVQPDAWPAVLAGTGIWIIAAEQDKITGNYRTTLIAKLGAELVPGVTAFLHARSRSTAGLAVFGAVTDASALTALFPASCWQAEPKYSHMAPRGPL